MTRVAHRLFAMLLLVPAACSNSTVRHGEPAATPAATAASVPADAIDVTVARGFYPYIAAAKAPDLRGIAAATGVKGFSLAFVIASSGRCEGSWGPSLPVGRDHIKPRIDEFRAAGGDVVLSFGGAGGTELGLVCTSPEQLADQYRKIAARYSIRQLDFDVEGAALADTVSVERRSRALAILQHQDPGIRISYTLEVRPYGLGPNALAAVRSAITAGVHLSIVNIMTMDFNKARYPEAAHAMAAFAERSAEATIAQLAGLYPALPRERLWAMLGITPMLGLNDEPTETFTPADASRLARYAKMRGAGRITMWAVNRDKPCDQPHRGAISTCSGTAEAPFTYSRIFASLFP